MKKWNEEVLVELGSWVLLIVVCLLLGMLVSGCRTKSVVCGITEEYADSLKTDSTVKETYIYSGKSLAEEISMEEVEIDWEDSASVEDFADLLKGVKRLKAGKVTVKRFETQTETQTQTETDVETQTQTKTQTVKKETKKVEPTVAKTITKTVMWISVVAFVVFGVLLWVNRKRISARIVSIVKRIE